MVILSFFCVRLYVSVYCAFRVLPRKASCVHFIT